MYGISLHKVGTFIYGYIFINMLCTLGIGMVWYGMVWYGIGFYNPPILSSSSSFYPIYHQSINPSITPPSFLLPSFFYAHIPIPSQPIPTKSKKPPEETKLLMRSYPETVIPAVKSDEV